MILPTYNKNLSYSFIWIQIIMRLAIYNQSAVKIHNHGSKCILCSV